MPMNWRKHAPWFALALFAALNALVVLAARPMCWLNVRYTPEMPVVSVIPWHATKMSMPNKYAVLV